MSTAASPPPIVQRSSYLRVADAEEGLDMEPTPWTGFEPKSAEPLMDIGRSHPMADRFLRRGKRKVGVVDSLKAVAFSSCKLMMF